MIMSLAHGIFYVDCNRWHHKADLQGFAKRSSESPFRGKAGFLGKGIGQGKIPGIIDEIISARSGIIR